MGQKYQIPIWFWYFLGITNFWLPIDITGMYVWYLELSRKPRHVAQQMRCQNVGLWNGHCLGTISAGCDF